MRHTTQKFQRVKAYKRDFRETFQVKHFLAVYKLDIVEWRFRRRWHDSLSITWLSGESQRESRFAKLHLLYRYYVITWYSSRVTFQIASRFYTMKWHLHCNHRGDLHTPYNKRSRESSVNERLSLGAWRVTFITQNLFSVFTSLLLSIVFNELTYNISSIQRATLPGAVFTWITFAVDQTAKKNVT